MYLWTCKLVASYIKWYHPLVGGPYQPTWLFSSFVIQVPFFMSVSSSCKKMKFWFLQFYEKLQQKSFSQSQVPDYNFPTNMTIVTNRTNVTNMTLKTIMTIKENNGWLVETSSNWDYLLRVVVLNHDTSFIFLIFWFLTNTYHDNYDYQTGQQLNFYEMIGNRW